MKITPWSPDPDKYADECGACFGAGVIAFCYPEGHDSELCKDCQGTGITVDWSAVEPALLGERR